MVLPGNADFSWDAITKKIEYLFFLQFRGVMVWNLLLRKVCALACASFHAWFWMFHLRKFLEFVFWATLSNLVFEQPCFFFFWVPFFFFFWATFEQPCITRIAQSSLPLFPGNASKIFCGNQENYALQEVVRNDI